MSAEQQLTFDPPIEGGVVVGYDGSVPSRKAVDLAADAAATRSMPLHVVRAWQLSNAMAEAGAAPGTVPSLAEVGAAVERSLAVVVQQVAAEHGGLVVTGHVQHAKATDALLAASHDAALMVVSRRGQGGFVDLLLGSTADQVIRYARCSVLVVRP